MKQLQVGDKHVLALTVSGKVYAWGSNEFGQVGTGEDIHFYDSPQLVYPISTLKSLPEEDRIVKQIVACDEQSYLLTSSGRMLTWGRNQDGLLGRMLNEDSSLQAVHFNHQQ